MASADSWDNMTQRELAEKQLELSSGSPVPSAGFTAKASPQCYSLADDDGDDIGVESGLAVSPVSKSVEEAEEVQQASESKEAAAFKPDKNLAATLAAAQAQINKGNSPPRRSKGGQGSKKGQLEQAEARESLESESEKQAMSRDEISRLETQSANFEKMCATLTIDPSQSWRSIKAEVKKKARESVREEVYDSLKLEIECTARNEMAVAESDRRLEIDQAAETLSKTTAALAAAQRKQQEAEQERDFQVQNEQKVCRILARNEKQAQELVGKFKGAVSYIESCESEIEALRAALLKSEVEQSQIASRPSGSQSYAEGEAFSEHAFHRAMLENPAQAINFAPTLERKIDSVDSAVTVTKPELLIDLPEKHPFFYPLIRVGLGEKGVDKKGKEFLRVSQDLSPT